VSELCDQQLVQNAHAQWAKRHVFLPALLKRPRRPSGFSPGSASSSATCSACRCGRGRRANTLPSISDIRSANAANDSLAPASAGLHDITRHPRACARATPTSGSQSGAHALARPSPETRYYRESLPNHPSFAGAISVSSRPAKVADIRKRPSTVNPRTQARQRPGGLARRAKAGAYARFWRLPAWAPVARDAKMPRTLAPAR
jgi:hypothetical protein